MSRILAACIVALVAFAPACQKKATIAPPTVVEDYSYARLDEVAVTHMDLDLIVDFGLQTISGIAAFDLDNKSDANVVHFDTWALHIQDVTIDGKEARWQLGDSVALLGRPLSVAITPESRRVTVRYATTNDARGVQWLMPPQTLGKHHPYVYTQSQSYHARSWVPCQDTPANRFTYSARVHVPAELLAVMSASNPQERSVEGVYQFEMKQPIPSYLLALAVGDIAYRRIGPRTGVYSEPGLVKAAAAEFSDMENMMDAAEAMMGPYLWERFDVLVLPPSFPFGGMENPRLTFATPVLVAGDRSLVSVIVHELAHSWSGNLVTNATWNDFWLNEGFTTYLERRLDEVLYGREYMEMQTLLGLRDVDLDFEEYGVDHKDSALLLDLGDRDFEEVSTTAAYEKGCLFLRMLEESFGRETFDPFLRGYFDAHAFQTMTTERFVAYMKEHLFANDEAKYAELLVDDWIYKPGMPANTPKPKSTRFKQVDAQIAAFARGTPARFLQTEGWTTNEWQRFLDNLPQPLTHERLADLESAFRFEKMNAVVQRSWFPNVIASKYEPAYPALEDFLLSIGRRYLIRPVYMKLAETPEGLEFARRVYAQARPGYHAITQQGIDPVLKWSEVAAQTPDERQ
ncbi:MAG: M1 family metallopeptidase [Candidatus Latescibacteria bacterium]|nr:M1 family metallopeptidase [Candidatus Latescibacterota bacterium]